jgi:HD-like signal output (HDOD) protein
VTSLDANDTAQNEVFAHLVLQTRRLSPLPAVAAQLLVTSEDTRFAAHDLAGTVSVDQALTLTVLRLANSPKLGMPRRITSLREAIVLLGFREVRSIALAACVVNSVARDAFARAGIDDEIFWMNSLIVAYLSQVLAAGRGHEGDQAFTAGLLHNMGRLAWAEQRPRDIARAASEAREHDTSFHVAQQRRFGFTDAELGGAVATAWAFPVELADAIAHHADPDARSGDYGELAVVVYLARRFARAHGISDGVDPVGTRLTPDLDWQDPRVERQLRAAGGVASIVDRAKSFLEIDERLT